MTTHPCESYFRLSEADEHRLCRARGILQTLSDLASATGPKATVTLPAEALDLTLCTVIELLDLPLQFVPPARSLP